MRALLVKLLAGGVELALLSRHSRRMRPEMLQRIGDLAKYVLNVGTSNKTMHATCKDARA